MGAQILCEASPDGPEKYMGTEVKNCSSADL